MQPVTVEYKGYTITTDKNLMKVQDIHKWLSEKGYWCRGVAFETVKRAFENSYCIGAIADGRQVAFARLVTDYAVFAWLADVYVEEAHRGKGVSKKMLDMLLDMEWVKGLRGIKLATRDAHGLYRQFGFTECKRPEYIMERNSDPWPVPINSSYDTLLR